MKLAEMVSSHGFANHRIALTQNQYLQLLLLAESVFISCCLLFILHLAENSCSPSIMFSAKSFPNCSYYSFPIVIEVLLLVVCLSSVYLSLSIYRKYTNLAPWRFTSNPPVQSNHCVCPYICPCPSVRHSPVRASASLSTCCLIKYICIHSLSNCLRMFIVWQEFCRLNKTFTFDSNLIRAYEWTRRTHTNTFTWEESGGVVIFGLAELRHI